MTTQVCTVFYLTTALALSTTYKLPLWCVATTTALIGMYVVGGCLHLHKHWYVTCETFPFSLSLSLSLSLYTHTDGHLKQGYYANLKKLIETTYNTSGGRRVVLVAHSMGSPISLFFLAKFVNQTWKDKHIRAYITVSGVWHGAGQLMKAIVSGNNDHIFFEKDILSREIQRSLPGNIWLLPFPSDTWTHKDVLVVTPTKNYTAWDYKELFHDMNYTHGWRMYNEVKNLTGHLPAPNVTMYCFYGKSYNSTPQQFVYGPGEFPNKDPSTIIMGHGDETVNLKSLMACSRWKGAGDQHYDVTLREFPNVEHLDMIKNQDVIKALDAIVYSPDEKI